MGAEGAVSSLTFDGNRLVEFAPGARIKPLSNLTVVIECPIRTGRFQIFDTSLGGTIKIGPNGPRTVFPEWWGAKANGTVDCTPAIQRAVDAITDPSTGARGGEVVFTAGEYQILGTITLPRGYDRPKLALRGLGVFATALHAPPGYPPSGPLIVWDEAATDKWVRYQTIRDMQISRTSPGVVIQHSLLNDQLNGRLFACKFDNLFLSAGNQTSSGVSLEIEGALNSSFRDIGILGGNIGLRLKNSSHVEVSNFRTEIDKSVANGIVIEGGGNHVFVQTRIEGVNGGSGVRIDGGAKNVIFNGVYFEGKETNPQIDIRDASLVTIINPALAQPRGDNIVGLRIGALATAIRVIGGNSIDFATAPNSAGGQYSGCLAVLVESGARYVTVEGLNIVSPWDVRSDARANIVVQSGAKGVDILAYQEIGDLPANQQIRVTSGPATLAQSSTPSVSEGGLFTTANTTATTITNFVDGHPGQEITVIFNDAQTTVQAGATIQLTSAFTSTPNDVLKLIYDGSKWREVSRSILS